MKRTKVKTRLGAGWQIQCPECSCLRFEVYWNEEMEFAELRCAGCGKHDALTVGKISKEVSGEDEASEGVSDEEVGKDRGGLN